MNAVSKRPGAPRRLLVVAALTLAFSRLAAADMLPSIDAARDALWASPMVLAAQAELAAQQSGSAALANGTAEWTIGGDLAQRRVGGSAATNYTEWGATVSRPIRMPARAAADRALGLANISFADASLGEALHETGRSLLSLWFDWLGEASLKNDWMAQRALAEKQREIVAKRHRLGEAAKSEIIAINAALAQARYQAQLADARAARAHSQLAAAFPNLVEPATLDLPPPEAVTGDEADWVTAALAHNHELARARADAQRLARHAEHLQSRVSPDPSVGLFARRENGNESVVGINVGFTLPNASRQLEADAARTRADAAAAAATRLEARLTAEARLNFANARASLAAWQEAETAAVALEESARLSARAFELGEGELAPVLSTRRLAIEGRIAATSQRREAQYSRARLQLDAHRLWPLDAHPDEEDSHAHHY